MVCHKKINNNFNNYISHQKPQRKWQNKFQVLKGKKKNTSNPEFYMQQKYLSETDMK